MMDWQSILTILGIVLFVVIMMRGCGGMMGGGCGMGGCGMGSRRKQQPEEKEGQPPPAPSETKR